MKNWLLFVSVLYTCLLCDEIFLPLNFGTPRFAIRVTQDGQILVNKIFWTSKM